MRGRPPKPTKLLEIGGAFKKNPARGRARADEPVPEGPLGPPPAEWTAGAEKNARLAALLRAWQEIVDQAAFGVLTSADRDLVELACYLKYKIRRASAGYEKATSGDFAQLNRILGQIGLVPSERSRVSGRKKAKEVASEWAKLAGSQRRQA